MVVVCTGLVAVGGLVVVVCGVVDVAGEWRLFPNLPSVPWFDEKGNYCRNGISES